MDIGNRYENVGIKLQQYKAWKEPILVALIIIITILSTFLMHGCNNEKTDAVHNEDIDKLASSLLDISYEVERLSWEMGSEKLGGQYYVDQEDLNDIDVLVSDIYALDENISIILSEEVSEGEILITAITKEKLRQMLYTIYNYILFRDYFENHSLDFNEIYSFLINDNANYSLQLGYWRDSLDEQMEDQLNMQELYAILLYEYLISAERNYFLNYYQFDNNVINLQNNEICMFTNYYNLEIEKILNQLNNLKMPDNYSLTLKQLFEVMNLIKEQNEFICTRDGSNITDDELHEMQDTYASLRDTLLKELMKQGLPEGYIF